MLYQVIKKIKPSFLTDYISLEDEDAIELIYWLKAKNNVPNTYSTYRVVIFRFYLWMQFKGLTLKTITRQGIIDYLEFMQNPPKTWCGPCHKFSHPNWRPFIKTLSQSSISFNMKRIRQLFIDLVDSSYIDKSPFPSNLKCESIKNLPLEKYITLAEFRLIYEYINQLSGHNPVEINFKARMKWVFYLLLYTGGRRTEIANAKMGDLFFKNERLWLRVIGKGNKYGEIPITKNLRNALNEYRLFYGLPKICSRLDLEMDIPLIIKANRNGKFLGIDGATIWYSIKKVCLGLSDITEDKVFSEKLKRFSTHWFRHTSATMQVDAGIDIRIVQRNMRHKSIETTMRYQHINQDYQYDETISKFII